MCVWEFKKHQEANQNSSEKNGKKKIPEYMSTKMQMKFPFVC